MSVQLTSYEESRLHLLFIPEIKRLFQIFKNHGFELRIVGGAIRDILINKEPLDIDFVTTASPRQMAVIFTIEGIRMLSTGARHGTITIRMKNNYEITTLKNGSETNWELDAMRRDFTINALFVDSCGTLFDYCEGYKHLKLRKLCFIGDVASRINEDHLRILRYFRFYGHISADSHDVETLNVIQTKMKNLKTIPGERLWSELKKIVMGKKEIMLQLLNLQFASFIGLPIYLNKVEHTIEFQDICDKSENSITRLAALLKDKEEVSVFSARMKLSKYDRGLASFIVNHRTHADNDKLKYCQSLLISHQNQNKARNWIMEFAKYLGIFEELNSWNEPTFPINGKFLIMRCGLKEGPHIKTVLSRLKEEWILNGYKLSEQQLHSIVTQATLLK